jgi:hypothetical protein
MMRVSRRQSISRIPVATRDRQAAERPRSGPAKATTDFVCREYVGHTKIWLTARQIAQRGLNAALHRKRTSARSLSGRGLDLHSWSISSDEIVDAVVAYRFEQPAAVK